jgi:protoporphyrinogen oxidase
MKKKTAIIIGAGPAGLTAAYELLKKTNIKPIIYEKSGDIGGISKTIKYKGNRIDIGGHRFFSKSNRVMQWWLNILPLQAAPSKDDVKLKRNLKIKGNGKEEITHTKDLQKTKNPDPEKTDRVMLIRQRMSRIFFQKNLFDYPISLNINTIKSLGLFSIIKIGLSYLKISVFPIKNEKNLEEFFINRFGKELYKLFFEEYTEKVWGVPPHEIDSAWGAQRVKGLSITKTIINAIQSMFSKDSSIEQKSKETSLIDQFMYPKFGPGHMWETVAKLIEEKGGVIHLNHKVVELKHRKNKIIEVSLQGKRSKNFNNFQKGDYFFSTMAVRDLIQCLKPKAPYRVNKIAKGLIYRDFITVGVLLKKLKLKNKTKRKAIEKIVPDNWIYIQEKDVRVARLQIFNNWSPYMVYDDKTVWIGLEYFCDEGDNLWQMADKDLCLFAIDEIEKIGIIEKRDVIDSTVIRMPKAYPAYFGTYSYFEEIRKYVDTFNNLFLIGRNGMHRYNNADHSMLTAMVAVDNIVSKEDSKDNIWSVNMEKEYHESKEDNFRK